MAHRGQICVDKPDWGGPASAWGGPSQWSAHAAAQLSIQQGGFGEYSVIGSGEEDLCLDGYGCIYSDYIHGDVLVSVPYPDIEIFASDYAPYLNSGPVQVWAELDPFWASPEPIAWGGCEPDGSNAICWFEPSAVGPHTVSAWSPGGGFDSVLIDVQEPPSPSCEYAPDHPDLLGASSGLYMYHVITANIESDEILGVKDGFKNWTIANEATMLNARYCAQGDQECDPGGQVTAITVMGGNAGSGAWGPNYAQMAITDSNGRPTGGLMVLSTNENLVSNRDGHKKITQHELGHFHGMDDDLDADTFATVMRIPIGKDGRYLPEEPTFCDAAKAFERGQ